MINLNFGILTNYILDYIYNKKEIDNFGGVCPSMHIVSQQ